MLRYMDEAAEALDLMNNDYQLQHLDIKPQNLFLVHNHIKVADFGLVKDLEGIKASVTGGVTPLYAAPETFDGWVSRFCDQYSLAIVYQELLTGKRPYPGTNARQLIMQHLQGVPDLTSLPPGDREVIGRALSKMPQDRFPTCTDLVRALRTSHEGGTVALPTMPAISPVAASRQDTDAESLQTNEDRQPRVDPAASVPFPGRTISKPTGVIRKPALAGSNETPQPAGQRRAPSEIQGEGVLFPALVIGLGQMGLHVLQRLREGLHAAFGPKDPRETLPHLRMLYIDTDPDGLRQAVEGGPARALVAQEIVLARLNRPSQYMKPPERLAALQTWCDPQMLFRIPRNQLTAGLRALGRLALVDNFPLLLSRIRTELDSCADPDALKTAERRTGLGIRSNWPRVYVVTSLMGGTGSGMFLDLAYVIRQQLKQLGFERPDVVGVLLAPEVERQTSRTLPLGNAFASLTELCHFSDPNVTFTSRLGVKDGFLSDSDRPFDQCVMVPLPAVLDDESVQKTAGLAGGYLLRGLTTPLGKTVDSQCLSLVSQSPQPLVTTFGVHRLAWPRQTILRRMVRGLCLRLARHWMNKEAEPVRTEVTAWITDQWSKRELQTVNLTDQLETACETALGEMPESAFTHITERFVRRGPNGIELDGKQALQALAQLEQLVGHPQEETKGLRIKIVEALDTETRKLAIASEQKLAEVAVCLVEQPQFRLAGAEEAIRQLSNKLEQLVTALADSTAQIVAETVAARDRIRTLAKSLTGASSARSKIIVVELLELLRDYPRKRYQALVDERVTSIYRHMLTNCPEYLRELGFCRARLGDLQRLLETTPETEGLEIDLGPGQHLLPASCPTMDAVVEHQLQTVTPEEFLDFDHRVQALIRKQFKALVNVCMSANNMLKDLQIVMYHQAEPFIENRLGKARVVDIYLDLLATPATAQELLRQSFQKAEPALRTSAAPGEVSVLVVPADPAVERLRGLLKRLLPQVEVLATANSNDIVFFREQTGLRLADVPQLGAVAREAYEQMIAVQHFTPHNRTDIGSWHSNS
jgi:hypothetical protein